MDRTICNRENCLALVQDFKDIINWLEDFPVENDKRAQLQNEINGMVQFKYALYFIWQKYHLGNDEDVWEDGESMLPYHFFLSDIKRGVFQLCMFCLVGSPLMYYRKVVSIDRPEQKTEILKKLLEGLQGDLSNGVVKVI